MRRPFHLRLGLLALGLALSAARAGGAAPDRAPSGQDVTIVGGKDRTVYEFRRNGELRLVKIVPAVGSAYFLVPADETQAAGDLHRADMLLPQWRLLEF